MAVLCDHIVSVGRDRAIRELVAIRVGSDDVELKGGIDHEDAIVGGLDQTQELHGAGGQCQTTPPHRNLFVFKNDGRRHCQPDLPCAERAEERHGSRLLGKSRQHALVSTTTSIRESRGVSRGVCRLLDL